MDKGRKRGPNKRTHGKLDRDRSPGVFAGQPTAGELSTETQANINLSSISPGGRLDTQGSDLPAGAPLPVPETPNVVDLSILRPSPPSANPVPL